MTQHHSGRPYAGCEHTQAIRIRKIKGIISPGLKSDILRRNSRFESSATSGIIAYLGCEKTAYINNYNIRLFTRSLIIY
ncbi:MAG: hypothetical protein EGQ91_08995 [Clostridiales bacterium]|nr:hypothetical protein [Clostridiales bacterium]MBD8980297.1 hypothetical protein [Clostridiales bacterium]